MAFPKPTPEQIRRDLAALRVGFTVGAVMVGCALGLFIGIWGWTRFKLDFWPLDASRVGPNLIASFVIVVLVTAHNEARIVQQGLSHHRSLQDIFSAMKDEILHPVEVFQDSVADAVADAVASLTDEEEDHGSGSGEVSR